MSQRAYQRGYDDGRAGRRMAKTTSWSMENSIDYYHGYDAGRPEWEQATEAGKTARIDAAAAARRRT